MATMRPDARLTHARTSWSRCFAYTVRDATGKALELAAESTALNDFKDWWWKARLGKCYYMLGLHRDAERQARSSIKEQPMMTTFLELGTRSSPLAAARCTRPCQSGFFQPRCPCSPKIAF